MSTGTAIMVGLAILLAPLAGGAQPAGGTWRIGVISGASPDPTHPVHGLEKGLSEFGYVQGRNLILELRWAHGHLERIPGLVAELIRLKVDVIVAANTEAAVEAKKATQTIPIVMAMVSDPVGRGLIASFAKPGGNVTGMHPFALELTVKQLELLREAFPKASRFAVLWNPSYRPSAAHRASAEAAAAALKLRLKAVGASRPDELTAAFATMAAERIEAVLAVADPTFWLQRAQLATLAAKYRLPVMYGLSGHAQAGGLIQYSADLAAIHRRAAYYVDKILKGVRPEDLPVEQPRQLELVINLKAAKELGVTMPRSLLLRADHVIE
ncbi:MAG: ABC transporter substrate-binding protein [Candidatus Rokuibacteriota bacterium]